MPRITKKRPRDGQEASWSSIQASTGTVIPGNFSELSISELKNLCCELNFSSTGGRWVLVKRLENERNRRRQSTSQASITPNNPPSVPTEREIFSADQIAQITQIVSQSISSFFDSQQTASRVVEQPVSQEIWPPRAKFPRKFGPGGPYFLVNTAPRSEIWPP